MRCINAWKTREATRADGPAPGRRRVLLWGVGCALGLSGPSASGQAPDDPFLDPAARRLVEGARAAWESAASALDSYTARIHGQQRWRIVATRRNYVMQDLRYAARLRWARRQAAVVRLDGYWVRHSALASEVTAQAVAEHVGRLGGRHPSGDPFRFARSLLPEAADGADEAGFVSPLDAGAEPFYRYRSGDTTTVLLPNGDAVRAVEVVAMPRYRAARFVAAILWIEADSHAVVRLAFRPGKPLDRELAFCVACPDGSRLDARVDLQGPEAAPDDSARAARPGFFGRLANAALNSALPRFEIAVASVVVDYGLWNSRHWLPRSMTWLGHAAAYDEAVANENVPDVAVEVSSQLAFEIDDVREAGTDAETTAQVVDRWRELGDSVFGGDRAEGPGGDPGEAAHIVPGESGESVSTRGELFVPAAWDADAFAPGGEAQRHASQLAAVPVGGAPADGQAESGLEASPWTFEPPFLTLRLLDYNSTEGFSVGTRLWRRYSRGRAVLSARWARTPGRVEVRLATEREYPRLLLGVSAYRDARPVGWVREFGALQPDETVGWYTADGIGARLSPARRRRESVSLRVFAERHDEFGADLSRETLWGASAHWSPWWGGGVGPPAPGRRRTLAPGHAGRRPRHPRPRLQPSRRRHGRRAGGAGPVRRSLHGPRTHSGAGRRACPDVGNHASRRSLAPGRDRPRVARPRTPSRGRSFSVAGPSRSSATDLVRPAVRVCGLAAGRRPGPLRRRGRRGPAGRRPHRRGPAGRRRRRLLAGVVGLALSPALRSRLLIHSRGWPVV